MPTRWKIFLGLNFVLSIPAFICFILMIIQLLNTRLTTTGDFLIFFLVFFGLAVITLNGFLNIFMLQQYFPDKSIPANVKSIATLSLILNIITCIGFLILILYAASWMFRYDAPGRDFSSGKRSLAIISLAWIIQLVVLTMQSRLPALINRNNKKSISNLIDSIGQ
ncbi:MAG: hypothetical protein E6H09_21455 [Bacteroidetes bacterium]|nr:MAG: hypothetical protein E6H09_21455 [Bacteroidota bacterium]